LGISYIITEFERQVEAYGNTFIAYALGYKVPTPYIN